MSTRTTAVNIALGIACIVGAVTIANATLGPELGIHSESGVDQELANVDDAREGEWEVGSGGPFEQVKAVIAAIDKFVAIASVAAATGSILANVFGLPPSIVAGLTAPLSIIIVVGGVTILLRFRV